MQQHPQVYALEASSPSLPCVCACRLRAWAIHCSLSVLLGSYVSCTLGATCVLSFTHFPHGRPFVGIFSKFWRNQTCAWVRPWQLKTPLSICSFLAQTELGVLYHATLRQCRCEISDRTCALSPYEFGAVTVQASDLRSDVRAVRFGEIGRHRHTI